MTRSRPRLLADLILALAFILAACGGNGDNPLPTELELPTLTASPVTEMAQAASPDPARTLPASWTPTPTITPSPTVTVTPSATITDTPTRTPTSTPSETPEPNILSPLVELALQATILPVTYLPPTPVPPGPTAVSLLATPLPATQCQYLPPGGFGQAIISDPTLVTQIGCPVGAPPATLSLPAATQAFERGMMVWVSNPPGVIYVLYNNGTFQRYDDTFNESADPINGAQTPPAGLLEPVRGFGKVWRQNDGVRSGVGWATAAEVATSATSLEFTMGRMLYLPTRGDILILIYQGGATTGIWRAVPGPF